MFAVFDPLLFYTVDKLQLLIFVKKYTLADAASKNTKHIT